jgi:lipopolysaccharide/colanic/teichoic acid biosynthesis glycosyltransferase
MKRFVKRTFDLVCVFFASIVFSPFFILVYIAIKMEDGGPAIFKQERIGYKGKTFNILKFRTMRVDSESDGEPQLAKTKDERLTRIGKFLREHHLDELPQLLNVLFGDMSFVGPRPERPEIAKQYEKDMPEFALRLQVKAGLTGYAQVYGKYNTPPYDKVQMDLMYVANQSIIEDLKLMLMTFKILFIPSSTEGVSADQTTAKKEND